MFTVATTKKNKPKGVLHSVYFPTQKDLDRVKRAAKVADTKLSVFMRDGIYEKCDKVMARGKKKVAA